MVEAPPAVDIEVAAGGCLIGEWETHVSSTRTAVTEKSFEQILEDLDIQDQAEGPDAGTGMTIWAQAYSTLELALYLQPMLLDAEVAAEQSGCIVTFFDETETLTEESGLLASTAIAIAGSVAELTWFFHLMIAFRARGRRH